VRCLPTKRAISRVVSAVSGASRGTRIDWIAILAPLSRSNGITGPVIVPRTDRESQPHTNTQPHRNTRHHEVRPAGAVVVAKPVARSYPSVLLGNDLSAKFTFQVQHRYTHHRGRHPFQSLVGAVLAKVEVHNRFYWFSTQVPLDLPQGVIGASY
jgi:hypothetical protein